MTKIFDPKITEGEWKALDRTNVLSGRRSVAVCGGFQSNIDWEHVENENFENTKAIAAVPELLKVLEAATKYINHCNSHEEDMRKWAIGGYKKEEIPFDVGKDDMAFEDFESVVMDCHQKHGTEVEG